ncbi:unnamed protein product [Cochlearia groenlandica]
MAKKGNDVKLIGFWISPFSRRVEMALKLKGIPYEYLEEDLPKKTHLLLELNPVHKKVPVLVHNDNIVSESHLILEYIDQTWTNNRILPKDPYEKAMARFWAKFVDEQIFHTGFFSMAKAADETEREKVAEQTRELITYLEKELVGKDFFGGETVGFLDLVAGSMIPFCLERGWEGLGIEVITEEKFPEYKRWAKNLENVEFVKESIPPKDKHIEHMNYMERSSPEKVKLLGMWASPFSRRIEMALILKGVPYEFSEQDITNKTPLLLQSNPVHQKIPVLLHKGKPISESLVILEYIDDTWTNNPILPRDPYERAVARFWSKFVDEEIYVAAMKMVGKIGEERDAAVEATRDLLKLLEKELAGKDFLSGDRFGFADIVATLVAFWLMRTEAIVGVKVVTAEMFPEIHRWVKNLLGLDVVKNCIPPEDEYRDYIEARMNSLKIESQR